MEYQEPQDIFEFLTDPKRFETAAQIYDHLPGVRDKLIKDFWEPIIHDICLRLGNKWNKVDTDSVLNTNGKTFRDRWGGFYLFQTGWEGTHIGIESLSNRTFYGFTFAGREKGFDREKMDKYLKDEDMKKTLKYASQYWLGYNYFNGYDFLRMQDCMNILPANRDKLMKEITNKIIDFCNEMEPHLIQLNKMKK